MDIFLPLIKADAAKRLIHARAADETPDKAREVFDYVTSKPNFQAWSKGFEDATNGLSKGNVRVMHTKVVAGKVSDIIFDDVAKSVDVFMKIVDENEWAKVEAGLYTGVSIGGSYAKKWQDGDYTRYTANPSEISLVDNPCIPTARFLELQKADGLVEQIALHGRIDTFAAAWAARPATFGQTWTERPRTFGEMMRDSQHLQRKGW